MHLRIYGNEMILTSVSDIAAWIPINFHLLGMSTVAQYFFVTLALSEYYNYSEAFQYYYKQYYYKLQQFFVPLLICRLEEANTFTKTGCTLPTLHYFCHFSWLIGGSVWHGTTSIAYDGIHFIHHGK